jgi:hypothetical protein
MSLGEKHAFALLLNPAVIFVLILPSVPFNEVIEVIFADVQGPDRSLPPSSYNQLVKNVFPIEDTSIYR